MNRNHPNILLINPWVHDFAAYDFWAKPMGLLTLAGILRHHGLNVNYIDCLERFHPKSTKTDPSKRYGRGPYLKRRIPKPEVLKDVPRHFSCYGILPEWFLEDLNAGPIPDLIFMTSIMTYWYPGVFETIRMVKTVFPKTPIILGGTYATLCSPHAENHAGADRVVSGPGEDVVFDVIEEYLSVSVTRNFDSEQMDSYPYPVLDLQKRLSYVPILTSRGCPFRCPYCASQVLAPKRMRRSPESVVKEIRYWHKDFGVKDFVFYDDALLMDAEHHIIPVFEAIINQGIKVRFHTPNAVHIRGISEKTARLMYAVGFKTLRLGLETTLFDHPERIDKKVSAKDFKTAVKHLKDAGFGNRQVGAYLLAGLPGQTLDDLEESIRTVKESGITPIMAYYSPIPHTDLWEAAVTASRYDLNKDPLFTNNAIFPCRKEGFSWNVMSRLKELTASPQA